MTKLRLDKLMVERGLAPSREKAQALIMAGQVVVGDHAVDKSGHQVPNDVEIRIKGDVLPYVSRGGLKLRKALDQFDTPLDIGLDGTQVLTAAYIEDEGGPSVDASKDVRPFAHCIPHQLPPSSFPFPLFHFPINISNTYSLSINIKHNT